MRGEEIASAERDLARGELPPHARRRAGRPFLIPNDAGITSACAEKRCACRYWRKARWNYLRMRGEETALPAETLAVGVVL